MKLSRGARIAWLSLKDKYFSISNKFLTGINVTLLGRKIILGCCQDLKGHKVRFDQTKITNKAVQGWRTEQGMKQFERYSLSI